MLGMFLLLLSLDWQRETLVEWQLVVAQPAELVLPASSFGSALIVDRASGKWWFAGGNGADLLPGPIEASSVVDLGSQELVAVGPAIQLSVDGRMHPVTAALLVKRSERFGHETVSVHYISPSSSHGTESVVRQYDGFDLDKVTKKAIRASAKLHAEMEAKLAATTFTVVKGHVDELDQNGPTAVFLGIEDVTSLFTGVLIVSKGMKEPVYLPSVRADSFAVSGGFAVVRATGEGTMTVTQLIDGEWLPQHTVDLPKGFVLRSAYGHGRALFTVTGDKNGVWTTSFFPGSSPKRYAMPVSTDTLAFSQGIAYWLKGTKVKIREMWAE
jgi:hypothetical protein